jgi:hypothetical protein
MFSKKFALLLYGAGKSDTDNGDEILARRYLLSIGPIVCFLLVLCTTGGGTLLVLSQMNISLPILLLNKVSGGLGRKIYSNFLTTIKRSWS